MKTPDFNDIHRTKGSDAARDAFDASWTKANGGGADQPPRAGWRFIRDHQVIPPRMLVKALLPYSGIAFIGGQSGAGKTFIVTDLAVALGSMTPFFGRKVREKVGVAIIAPEGAEQIGNRLTAAASARGVDIRELPIAWRSGATLKSAADADAVGKQLFELEDEIRQQYGVRLGAAVIDTVAATFSMDDEDDNSEVAKALKIMRQVGDAFGGLVIPVHHYGKSAATGLRGGSAWRAGADVVLSVIADRKELTGEVSGRELALAKARDGLEGRIAAFALPFVQLGVYEDGDPFGTCIVTPQFDGQPMSQGRKAPEPASHRTFRDAFTEAVDACGKTIHIRNDGPAVRAVDVAMVRTEFDRRYATGEADPAKRKETQRKAFKRAMSQLSRQYPTWIDGNTEWIWSLQTDNRTLMVQTDTGHAGHT